MKKHIFSEKKLQEILQNYEDGKSIKEISKNFNVTSKVIRDRLEKMNADMSKIGNRKYYYDDNIFKEINTKEKAYWYGFLISDGYMVKNRNSLRLKLADKDKDHLYKFLDFLGCPHEILKYEINSITGNIIPKIEISNKILVQDLVRHGFIGNKENREILRLENKELERNLIRGMFDADGCISKNKDSYKINFTSGCYNYCNAVKVYFDSICKTNVNIRSHGQNAYRVDTGKKENIVLILKNLYKEDDISLDRKYNIALKAIDRLEPKTTKTQDY